MNYRPGMALIEHSFRKVLALFLMLVFLGCRPKAMIEGEVKDYFGGPLEGVVVEIPGTQFSATTAQDGKYRLQYLPGRFQLNFTKQGYLDSNLDFEVTTETKIPAAQVALLKLPPSHGMYVVDHSEYKALPTGTIDYETIKSSPWDRFRNSFFRVEGEFAQLKGDSLLVFLDNDGQDTSLFSVDDKGTVLTSRRGGGVTRDDGVLMRDTREEIAPGYWRREVELRPGRYAFIAVRWQEISLNQPTHRIGARLYPVTDPVYLLEVVASEPKASGD